jgi:hypothetical protein
MFLGGIFKNLSEFLSDYQEWHSFVEGFCETFCFWKSRYEPSEELLNDIKNEHHYYVFGRALGFIALAGFGVLIAKILVRKCK